LKGLRDSDSGLEKLNSRERRSRKKYLIFYLEEKKNALSLSSQSKKVLKRNWKNKRRPELAKAIEGESSLKL
jgi:hypothetical protein